MGLFYINIQDHEYYYAHFVEVKTETVTCPISHSQKSTGSGFVARQQNSQHLLGHPRESRLSLSTTDSLAAISTPHKSPLCQWPNFIASQSIFADTKQTTTSGIPFEGYKLCGLLRLEAGNLSCLLWTFGSPSIHIQLPQSMPYQPIGLAF